MIRNAVIYLIGYPGVGKYTIAKEIARQSDFIVLDNQLINNPVFNAVGADGKTPLPQAVWDNVEKIRDVVLHVIENIAPRYLNYILTNVVMDDPEDQRIFEKITDVFKRRDSTVFPVFLSCNIEEHKKRIVAADRKERFKDIDPDTPQRFEGKELIKLPLYNCLEIDITNISPDKAAGIILQHVKRMMDGNDKIEKVRTE